jgi:putative flippase GtrA
MSHRRTFPRSALTSLVTTSLDFALLVALVELAGASYALATWCGTVLGSTSNFLINRRWAFAARGGAIPGQAGRYVLVQIGSSALHTLGVWQATRLGIAYMVAKVVVAIAAYLVWNYPLNHHFVFSRPREAAP